MPDYLIGSGLPVYPVLTDDKEVAKLLPVYRAINSLAQKLSELTGNVQYSAAELSNLSPYTGLLSASTSKLFVQAFEALSYGSLVNIFDNFGTKSVRKADRSLNHPAHGVIVNPSGVTAGSWTEILFMQGRTQSISGANSGVLYWLATGGAITSIKPTTGVIQPVGWGLGTGGFYLNIESPR